MKKKTSNTSMDNKQKVSFSALDPYLTSNIPLPTEKEISGRDFIIWGDRNSYPEFLYDLYTKVPVLQSIVNQTADYVVGDGASTSTIIGNKRIEKLVKDISMSYLIYGGFALNILRNKLGGIADVQSLDFRNCRTNKDNSVIYYSTDWTKTYGRVKSIAYKAYNIDDKDVFSSVYYYKNTQYQTYPCPMWQASILSVQVDRMISEYQINSISNGFASNIIVSMNNGIPSDEVKEEIEEAFDEKFTGYQNAGRPMIVYNNDKEHSVEVIKVDSDNFLDRYTAASDKCRRDIFTSFRAHPVLFGIPTENSGFSDQDFSEAFKLYNRTVVRPVQKLICNTLDEIFNEENTLLIKPFSIDWNEGEEDNVK